MRHLFSLLLFFLLLFLQVSFFSSFTLFGGAADILLVVLVYFAWQRGLSTGLLWGVGFGLAQDIVLGVFPFAAISKGVAAGLIGYYHQSLTGSPVLVYTLLVGLGSTITVLLEAVIYYFRFGEIFPFFFNIFISSLILNTLLGFILFPLLRRIPQGKGPEDV